jgi:hypothetical protein
LESARAGHLSVVRPLVLLGVAFLLAGCGGAVSFDVSTYPRTTRGVALAFASALADRNPDKASFYVVPDAQFVVDALPGFVDDFARHRVRIARARPRHVVFAIETTCGRKFRTKEFVDIDLARSGGRWAITAVALDLKFAARPQPGCP